MQLLLLVNILKTTMCILLFYVHNIDLQMYFTNIQYSRLPAHKVTSTTKRVQTLFKHSRERYMQTIFK